jgi:hypothetical protein
VLRKCKSLPGDQAFTAEETITRLTVRYREHLDRDDSLQGFLEECWQEEHFQLFMRIVLELRLNTSYDRVLQVRFAASIFLGGSN